MLRALDHSHRSSPCVPEELGSEGRSWAPETKMEPQSQPNEHLGGTRTLGRRKGLHTLSACCVPLVSHLQTVPLK